MKDRYLFLISLIIVIIQTSILPFFKLAGVVVSFPLIFLISGTVIFGHWKGLRIAVYLGILLDILVGKGLGVYVFIYLIISYVISSFEEKIFKENFITPVILFIFSSLFEIIFFAIYKYISMGFAIEVHSFLFTSISYSLSNSILGIPIYSYLMKKYMGYSMR